MPQHWLVKSEPDCYSIDDLANDGQTEWTGVRNYQARNFMRDQMKIGDQVLYYHSSSNPMQIVGLAEVTSQPHPDTTAYDLNDDHYDPTSTPEHPRWYVVDIRFKEKFKNPLSLEQIKLNPQLQDMLLAKRGNRLSVMPVEEHHFQEIIKLTQ